MPKRKAASTRGAPKVKGVTRSNPENSSSALGSNEQGSGVNSSSSVPANNHSEEAVQGRLASVAPNGQHASTADSSQAHNPMALQAICSPPVNFSAEDIL
ncbi:hypothetical protein TKK_0002993 [Trichogramma kaykai]